MEGELDDSGTARQRIRVRGRVQGVGFRPTVARLAREVALAGFVRNELDGVVIELEGPPAALARFSSSLRRAAPPMARIDAIEIASRPIQGETGFCIVASEHVGEPHAASLPPDLAICESCVRELFDETNRRFRHPFINCTDCGPRFTIARSLPYDRARTTMADFTMCASCQSEYEDPRDRRFHAEAICCRSCGPRVALVEKGARAAHDDRAVGEAAKLLERGGIVALKGLGGFQLAVDARNDKAVSRLRSRKHRPHRPFALMVRDIHEARAIVDVDLSAERELHTPARPIVVLPSRDGGIAQSVAPGLHELGVMLPTTALHHLLLREGPSILVVTSGNFTDEPIAIDDDVAFERLGNIADAFLVHDREIHVHADDSVGRIVCGALQPMRRGRGWAPEPIRIGSEAPDVLAVGAQMKGAFCLASRGVAYLSQHLGDMDALAVQETFEAVRKKLSDLVGARPEFVAHDLHPDYASTRWALASGLRAIGVQHHHAHVASCVAENGHLGPAIGVAFDGTGCGPAGDAWGGEILAFSLLGYERLGHLRPLLLPGGEIAIRQPWRLAAAALLDAGLPATRMALPGRPDIKRLLAAGIQTPSSTGAGRWFDAVAALLGVRDAITYEAQAACELEAIADRDDDAAYLVEMTDGVPFEIDLRPTIRAIENDLTGGTPTSVIASRFHSTMAEAIASACAIARARTGLEVVALSGGCFQNVLLTERVVRRLSAGGFRPLLHRLVPPNDGGLALGQAAVAVHCLSRTKGGS